MKNIMIILIMTLFFAVYVEGTLYDTRYKNNHGKQPEEMERIWIKENDKFVAFIILEKSDNAYLVIREHTTGPSAFSYIGSKNSYYGSSALDDFLNLEYAGRFSSEISSFILESEIQITAESSIGCCGGMTEYIHRKFYVPSWTEMTGRHNNSCLQEGRLISAGFSKAYIKATNDEGAPSVWWLRTPSTWHFNRVLGINEEGGVSTGTTLDSLGVYTADVRPVFRISTQISVVGSNNEWFVE